MISFDFKYVPRKKEKTKVIFNSLLKRPKADELDIFDCRHHTYWKSLIGSRGLKHSLNSYDSSRTHTTPDLFSLLKWYKPWLLKKNTGVLPPTPCLQSSVHDCSPLKPWAHLIEDQFHTVHCTKSQWQANLWHYNVFSLCNVFDCVLPDQEFLVGSLVCKVTAM